MRRSLVAAALAAAVGAAIVAQAARTAPLERPASARAGHPGPPVMPDAAAIAYIAVDGVRSATWPGYTWGAARASARVGARVIALSAGRWPRTCAREDVGLRA